MIEPIIDVEPSSLNAFKERGRSEAFLHPDATPGGKATIQVKDNGECVGTATGWIHRAGGKRSRRLVLKNRK